VRIFLDTNVLISAFATRGISADLVRFILTAHELLTGEVNLDELRRVLRDRFQTPADVIDRLEQQLRDQTIVPRPEHPSELPIRDPDDRWVLASAIAGQANLLVTGDEDLLSITDPAPLPIVSPRGCWERLRGSG
jgi:putative PIN family toxin of toxin-antitoxin system